MDHPLSPDENELYVKIHGLLQRARDLYSKSQKDEAWKFDEEAIPLAVELHKKLANRGKPPKFRTALIENRRAPVGSREFYRHHHSLEALLEFINMPDIAGDLPDLTINAKFNLRVFSRRSGFEIEFILMRLPTGWRVTHASSCDCGLDCRPFLFHELENEGIQYPHNLPDRMEFLWERAKAGKSPAEIQRAFDDLGKWLSDNEQRTPTGGAWVGYT